MKIFESVAALAASHLVAGQEVSTKSKNSGWEVTLGGPEGGAKYQVVTKAQHDVIRGTGTVDEIADHTLANGNVALIDFTDGNNLLYATQQSSSPILTNLELGFIFPVLLIANTTISAPVNVRPGRDIGKEIEYNITGDSVSVFTVTFNPIFNLAGGSYTHSGIGSLDIIAFRWNGAVWYETRRSLNLS